MPIKNKKTKTKPKKRNAYMVRFRKNTMTSYKPDFTTVFRLPAASIRNSSVADTKGALHFHLSQVPGYLTWRNLFDQYRINSVKVVFTPIMTEIQNRPFDDTTTPNIVNVVPNFACVRDNDDTATPVDYDALTNRAHCRICPATKKQVWNFTPTKLMMVYLTATTTGYKIDPDVKGWLDCAQAGIPHYGLKYALESASPSDAFVYRLDVSMNVSFKNRRD